MKKAQREERRKAARARNEYNRRVKPVLLRLQGKPPIGRHWVNSAIDWAKDSNTKIHYQEFIWKPGIGAMPLTNG